MDSGYYSYAFSLIAKLELSFSKDEIFTKYVSCTCAWIGSEYCSIQFALESMKIAHDTDIVRNLMIIYFLCFIGFLTSFKTSRHIPYGSIKLTTNTRFFEEGFRDSEYSPAS